MLHGFPEYQTEDMPTWGFFMSSSERPTAYSMACDAPWDLGWVTWRLIRFNPSGNRARDENLHS
jgi:hypothetical protein